LSLTALEFALPGLVDFFKRRCFVAEEKKLFSPAVVGELLNGWLIHSHKCRDRHDAAARLYAKGQYALGIPSLVVSTIVGTSVFSALSSKEVPALWVGILSIAAAVLAALQTFMDFGGRSDKHRSAGVKYKAAIRLLEQNKVRLKQGTEPSTEEIDSMRTLLDTLEDAAPVVMPKIYDQVEKKYRDLKYVEEAVSLYAGSVK
jgi:hypothetical protein